MPPRARLAVLPTGGRDAFHVLANLGAGRLLRIRMIKITLDKLLGPSDATTDGRQ
jgi:hypothetical protein